MRERRERLVGGKKERSVDWGDVEAGGGSATTWRVRSSVPLPFPRRIEKQIEVS